MSAVATLQSVNWNLVRSSIQFQPTLEGNGNRRESERETAE